MDEHKSKPKTINDVEAERDRYIARNAELESRLDQMRQISLGLMADRLGAIVPRPEDVDLTIKKAQAEQPWQGAYSKGVLAAYREGVPHILGAHTALHVAKTAGKLAAVFEELDHPADQYTALGAANLTDAQRQTVKDMAADLVTEALRFANLYGFDLETELRRRVAKQNPAPQQTRAVGRSTWVKRAGEPIDYTDVGSIMWLRFDAAEFPKYARKCTGKVRGMSWGRASVQGALYGQNGELTRFDIHDGKLVTLALFWPSAPSPGPHEHGSESWESLGQWLELEVKS